MTVAITARHARPPRRLNIGGPVVLGLIIIVAFFAGTLGWASIAPITKGATLPGTLIVEGRTRPVQHGKGGNVLRVHVREGQSVGKGQRLVTLDDAEIREAIRAANGQLAGARNEQAIVTRELGIIGDLVQRQLSPRPRLAELERQSAQVEKEIMVVTARVAALEQELGRTEIFAPISGRVLSLAVKGRGAVVTPGATVLEIVPVNDRLVIEGKLAANDIDGVSPGMRAKVWLSALNRREAEPLKGRVAWISPDVTDDKQTGQPHYLIRIVLKDSREAIEDRVKLYPGMRTEILLVKGTSTLLDRLLDPLTRNIDRAFRDH
jgi:multidrug efflux pump subunit AcrA (membrane-fusion protein)